MVPSRALLQQDLCRRECQGPTLLRGHRRCHNRLEPCPGFPNHQQVLLPSKRVRLSPDLYEFAFTEHFKKAQDITIISFQSQQDPALLDQSSIALDRAFFNGTASKCGNGQFHRLRWIRRNHRHLV